LAHPASLLKLIEDGVIDDVLYPLKSGKEADMFVVVKDDVAYAAKVYKPRERRSFKHKAGYSEGRTVRNTRSQRAMDKGTKFGKQSAEDAWQKTEADALRRLHSAGVRCPQVYAHYESVLVMELIVDADGKPAPQLAQLTPTPEVATALYDQLVGQVVLMLLSDMVHGDFSPYNVLIGANGPVVIDMPQVVSASGNLKAVVMVERDLQSVARYLGTFSPDVRRLGRESWRVWQEYERGTLVPEFRPAPPPEPVIVPGAAPAPRTEVALGEVMGLMRDARRDQEREDRFGGGGGGGGRGGGGRPRGERPQPRPPEAARSGPPRQDDQGPRRDERAPAARQDDRGPPPRRDDRGPPPRRDDRGPPPRRDDRGPPSRRDDRGPRQDDRGPPPRRDDRGPPPRRDEAPRPSFDRRPESERRDEAPRPSFDRGPRRDDRAPDRGPPRHDDRGPPRHDDRGPPRHDDRGPPRHDDRGPPRHDDRGPPRHDDRGPRRDDRGPPRHDDRGPPRHDDRGPPRHDDRGPPRHDDRGPRPPHGGQGGGEGGPGKPRRRRRRRGPRGGGGAQGGQNSGPPAGA
jgi:RIO kinase 1